MTNQSKSKPQTLKGFRDFLPADMLIRQKVIATLKEVFESYGFEPLETPSLEYQSTLLGKYGDEADKLVYTFKDQGGRDIGLRYDLTVPVSRVLAQYQNQLPLPFKRYQIQPVWRAEKPQKGRYREITQCDIDTFGTTSPLADAEIITVIYSSLLKLGFKKFVIRINSRQVLFELMDKIGVTEKAQKFSTIQAIDKLDKKNREEVTDELIEKGLQSQSISKLFSLIESAEPDNNLRELFSYIESLGVAKEFYKFDPILARGLDYYTGPIFETYVEEPKIGSITGGGRYDNLVKLLGGPDTPATGTTLGLDRICDVIRDQNLWPNLSPTASRALVTIFSSELRIQSIETANQLRQAGVNTELYPDPATRLDRQLKYANAKRIPFVIIIGPDEVKNNQVTLKNMATGKQETINNTNLNEMKKLLK